MSGDHERDLVDYSVVESPVGDLLVTSERLSPTDERWAVTGIYLRSYERGPEPGARWRRADDDATLARAAEQLRDYFGGRLRRFDLPVYLRGTEFQLRVWTALQAIPYGETVSYAEVARRVGYPGSARAAGGAIGRNPVSIVVPCHRVIGSGGGLTGYGGGLERKSWLLDHERAFSALHAPQRRR
jgi:methylated-DNA-[protein]-cysteine S-methyltransferase